MPTRIYHWKHGWIPLDHAAALSKAKGNHEGAQRYLEQAHAAGHAHASVVTGRYGGGTHERGLQPVAADHLPRARNVTAAFDPATRRFGLLHEADGNRTTAAIPEHLAEHLQANGHRITGIETHDGHKKIRVETRTGETKLFRADGRDKYQADTDAFPYRSDSDEALAGRLASTSDPAQIDGIIRELDRRDQLQKQRHQAAARRATRDAARDSDYDKRIDAGDDPEQAYEDVYGVPVAKQRQQAAISQLRDSGYKGAGFHELTAAAYRDHVSEQMIAAELATKGALFAGKTRAVETRNARRLFTDERYARAHASEDLRRWWDENGGFMTLADFRASILGGHKQKGRDAWY